MTLTKRRIKQVLSLCAFLLIVSFVIWYREASYAVPQNVPQEVVEEDLSPAIEDISGDEFVEEVSGTDGEEQTDSATPVVQTNAKIVRVIDGDTLDADADGIGEVRIRLLGVNTPETVDPRKAVECFGKEASDFSKHTLVEGSRIRLEADPQADERDKYGRLLRNVVLEDGTDYNATLVERGYAYAYLSFPLDPARKILLKRLEMEAKEAGRGLWGEGDCQ